MPGSIIGMIVIGFLAGLLARALKPGSDRFGCLLTTGLGMAGSLVAGYLGSVIGWYQPGEASGFIASVIGAVILLFVYDLASKGGRK